MKRLGHSTEVTGHAQTKRSRARLGPGSQRHTGGGAALTEFTAKHLKTKEENAEAESRGLSSVESPSEMLL